MNGSLAAQLPNGANDHIQSIDFTGDVTFPANSYRLLAFFPNLVKINGGSEHVNTTNVTSMEGLFLDDYAMKQVDMSYMSTSQVTDMNAMIYPAWINQISLGPDAIIHSNSGVKLQNGTWRNQDNNSTLDTQQLADNHPHPGTWSLQ